MEEAVGASPWDWCSKVAQGDRPKLAMPNLPVDGLSDLTSAIEQPSRWFRPVARQIAVDRGPGVGVEVKTMPLASWPPKRSAPRYRLATAEFSGR